MRNGEYYIGKSTNLRKRYKEHQAGGCKTTSKYLPVKLVCYSAFDTKDKADKYEIYLKTGSGVAFRNKHLV